MFKASVKTDNKLLYENMLLPKTRLVNDKGNDN